MRRSMRRRRMEEEAVVRGRAVETKCWRGGRAMSKSNRKQSEEEKKTQRLKPERCSSKETRAKLASGSNTLYK